MREAVLKSSSKQKGFTLIELVVAMAIFLVVIVVAFSTLSSYFAVRSANEQEMILQQNFRFALDKMAYDFRQASGEIILIEPDSNAMGEVLIFASGTNDIYYFLCSNGGVSVLYRGERAPDDPLTSDPCTTTDGWVSKQPITEDMHQLAKAYFVRSGGKVIMIVVGKLKYFGKERTISFTSLVFSRNSPNEPLPSP